MKRARSGNERKHGDVGGAPSDADDHGEDDQCYVCGQGE